MPESGQQYEIPAAKSPEQEITFSAPLLLQKLNAYNDATPKDITKLQFSKNRGNEIAQRQKFLLTEKPRVGKLNCKIDLWVYGWSKDGVDGKWGDKTEKSTKTYLERLFDPTHPERWQYVQTKLQARAQLELTQHDRKKDTLPQIVYAKEVMRKKEIDKALQEQKDQLIILQQEAANTPTNTYITQQITQLEQKIEKQRNIEQEQTRVENLFFVVTLDGEKVVYNEHAEQLYYAAQKAETSLKKINTNLPNILRDLVAKEKKRICTTEIYKHSILNYQQQWLSPEQAKKLADQQAEKAATTLAMREFSYTVATTPKAYGLTEKELQIIATNKDLQVFTILFEKTIIDRYEDITDQNHLDRDLPLPYDRYYEQCTQVALYENRIEAYLFDDPAKTPRRCFDKKNRSANSAQHLHRIITGNRSTEQHTTPEQQKEKDASTSNQQEVLTQEADLEQFTSNLNIFATKRMRQLLFYNHFTTLKNIFSKADNDGKTLQDKCDFSFDQLNLLSDTHTLQLPFSYHQLGTKLIIDGTTWDITIPELPDYLIWTSSSSTPLLNLAQTWKQWAIEQQLLSAAQLTEQEISQCTTQRDIQQLITTKMSNALLNQRQNTAKEDATATQVATTLEHQACLCSLRGYLDHTHQKKDLTLSLKPPQIRTKEFPATLRSIIYPQEGKQALTLDQTKELNLYLQDPLLHTCFEKITEKQFWFEDFLQNTGIMDQIKIHWPQVLIGFFKNLHKMATSKVSPQKEEWLQNLKRYQRRNHSLIGVIGSSSGSIYMYDGKQITLNNKQ